MINLIENFVREVGKNIYIFKKTFSKVLENFFSKVYNSTLNIALNQIFLIKKKLKMFY